MMTYKLESAEARSYEDGRFEIPTFEERNDVKTDHHVKLLFADADGTVERMWVKVVNRSRGIYYGTLANDPFGDFGDLLFGSGVEFGPEHICSIDEEDAT